MMIPDFVTENGSSKRACVRAIKKSGLRFRVNWGGEIMCHGLGEMA